MRAIARSMRIGVVSFAIAVVEGCGVSVVGPATGEAGVESTRDDDDDAWAPGRSPK